MPDTSICNNNRPIMHIDLSLLCRAQVYDKTNDKTPLRMEFRVLGMS